ncbi:diaminopropionate ammonia-lyase [Pelagibacterium lacus]|uniref:Diaminopropionate ammonia-lyase n=1 Tax=Pelagibacterium lacus TaxID=2282655 RepID=A0A369W1I7_9HYPH|nr:diaminopropionate ammonia-lyase [Pelagibacterium lacus]RDE07817.1 diaminopropionate ammonia-lyase [Pelagibacterium lacus]
MLVLNTHPDYRQPLEAADAGLLGVAQAEEVERFLTYRENHRPTPLVALPGLASELEIGALHLKDESQRLGLGSFKALGGSYAVIRLALAAAAARLGRPVDISELSSPDVRAVTSTLFVACATDGNHGRSVALGAQMVGARAVIFLHAGVSSQREQSIAALGAEIVRVDGNYDFSVAEASRVSAENGWTVVSDTSWPGYEEIPGLVMQGYTALLQEARRALDQPPTHVFIQSGVGGIAAAMAGYLSLVHGAHRPFLVVVDPERAACLFESARAGRLVKVAPTAPTVMAMLECFEPSLVAWRILSRAADAFMTVGEDDAVRTMNRLARPQGEDPAIVAGESGGAGLAGVMRVAADPRLRALVGLTAQSRVLVVNTEGATDPGLYEKLVGLAPQAVLQQRSKDKVSS